MAMSKLEAALGGYPETAVSSASGIFEDPSSLCRGRRAGLRSLARRGWLLPVDSEMYLEDTSQRAALVRAFLQRAGLSRGTVSEWWPPGVGWFLDVKLERRRVRAGYRVDDLIPGRYTVCYVAPLLNVVLHGLGSKLRVTELALTDWLNVFALLPAEVFATARSTQLLPLPPEPDWFDAMMLRRRCRKLTVAEFAEALTAGR